MKRYILDANVLVRFFMQHPPAMGRAATKLFEAAAKGDTELRLDPLIVAEVVFVLTKVYGQPRSAVADALLDLLENPGITLEASDCVRNALKRFKSFSVDFADAWVAAIASEHQAPIASFDRDLDKFKDVTRLEPPD